jgi:hypothetical protein
MITVNLLPYELRPVKRTPLPYIGVGASFILVLAVITLSFFKGVADIAQATRILDEHKVELAVLQPVVEDYNSLTQQKLTLATQVNTISEISSDRIIWSRQLFNLNRLALENMWYEGIEVATKPFTETSIEYNERTQKNETVTKRIDRQVLTLSGYVIPGDDGQASVSPFTLATESDDEFSTLFQLELSTFKDTLFEEVGVREFKLEYLIHRGGTQND